MKKIIKAAKYETVEDFFGKDEMDSKELVAGKAARAYRDKLRETHEAAASSTTPSGATKRRPTRETSAPNSAKSSTSKATRPTSGKRTSNGPSRKAVPVSSSSSARSDSKSSESPSPSPKGADPNLLRWQRLKAQYDKLKSNKKRIEFIRLHPGFDPKAGFEEAFKPQVIHKDNETGEEVKPVMQALEPKVIACADCGHGHTDGVCKCGCEVYDGDWPAALLRARARVAEYERQIQAGVLKPWPGYEVKDHEEDYWPIPAVLDMTPQACERRDEMVGRVLKIWPLRAYPDNKYRVDFNYSRRSYRVRLAEKLLSAEIESYASAYRVIDRGAHSVPPDEVLFERVRAAVVGLIKAHVKLARHYRGNVEPSYVEYRQWLSVFSLPEGYLIHEEQDRAHNGMMSPDMVRKFA